MGRLVQEPEGRNPRNKISGAGMLEIRMPVKGILGSGILEEEVPAERSKEQRCQRKCQG